MMWLKKAADQGEKEAAGELGLIMTNLASMLTQNDTS